MLYIIRHGKTDWNARLKLQGRTDIPLNEEGRAMARAAKDEVARLHFDKCYSSPLQRALETAQIILDGTGTPIIPDDRLIEMGFGQFEGIDNTYSNEKYPISVLFNHPENYTKIGDAESMDSLFERTGNFLDEVIKPGLEAGEDILIVGHGAMNCAIISQIRGYSKADFWKGMTGNCQLVKLI